MLTDATRELSALAQGRDDAPDFPTQRPARRCIDYRPREGRLLDYSPRLREERGERAAILCGRWTAVLIPVEGILVE